MMAKVGVVIPARNEEKVIRKTLEHLWNQTVKPEFIVVVNDGSKDDTSNIAREFGCFVVDLPDRGYGVTGQPLLANVINVGLHHLLKAEFLFKVYLDHIMILGADHILPTTYIEDLVDRMAVEPSLVVASGIIQGEKTVRTHARGSGRIVASWFWKKFGLQYPISWGWESWLCYKAQQMGYETRSFSDIISEARPTRYNPNKMLGWGKSMKALGYNWKYALARSFKTFMIQPRSGMAMLKGYFSNDVRRLDVAEWVGNWQKKNFWNRIVEMMKGG
jgi:glycosyltransferase involved in cell wall biosynthesis